MIHAIKKAFTITKEWIENGHENCYPPMIINITDGMYSDGTEQEILQQANNLKALHTSDGNVLFLNCHISDNQSENVIFPVDEDDIPKTDQLARVIFKMSSVMPITYNNDICDQIKGAADVHSKYIGMGYNSSMESLLSLLTIGTLGTSKKFI